MHHRTLHRALLLGALAAGAWTATELADDHAAHADTPPAVTIERPGGLVDRATKLPPRLPQQASARARAAVAKATAEPAPSAPAEPKPEPCEDQADQAEPTTPVEPDPTTEPEPEPSDEPTDPPVEDRPRSEPTPPVEAPPADEPPVDAPPAEVPAPVELPDLPPVEVPQLPAPPPVPTPVPVPSTGPPPPVVDVPDHLPDTGSTAPKPLPVPLPAPVVVPAPLPVVIGPIPAAEPPAGEAPAMLGQATAVVEVEAQWCPDQMRTDYAPDDRDMIRQLIASLTDGAETPRVQSAPGCPGTHKHPAYEPAGAAAAPGGSQTMGASAIGDVVGALTIPALIRLEHARARSTIPTGRHTSIEPGPA